MNVDKTLTNQSDFICCLLKSVFSFCSLKYDNIANITNLMYLSKTTQYDISGCYGIKHQWVKPGLICNDT